MTTYIGHDGDLYRFIRPHLWHAKEQTIAGSHYPP